MLCSHCLKFLGIPIQYTWNSLYSSPLRQLCSRYQANKLSRLVSPPEVRNVIIATKLPWNNKSIAQGEDKASPCETYWKCNSCHRSFDRKLEDYNLIGYRTMFCSTFTNEDDSLLNTLRRLRVYFHTYPEGETANVVEGPEFYDPICMFLCSMPQTEYISMYLYERTKTTVWVTIGKYTFPFFVW